LTHEYISDIVFIAEHTKVNKKPLWQDERLCYMYYACLNYCPQQSIQVNSKWYMKSYTEKNGRYSHPYATVKDIAVKNNRYF